MKHLLIAASVLAMTAGVASANITFSGTATAGIAKNGTKNNGSTNPNTLSTTATAASSYVNTKYHTYSNFDLAVTASGTTDSGLTFGVTDDINSGITYALAHDDGWDVKSGTLGTPTVYVSGSFGKVSFSANNFDAYNTDVSWSGNADVQYSGTFGGLTVGLLTDLESAPVAGSTGSNSAVQVSYTMGGIALSADYNQDNAVGYKSLWDASAAYTMGAFTGTLSATNDNNSGAGGTYDTNETLKLAYSANGIGAWAAVNSGYGTGTSAKVANDPAAPLSGNFKNDVSFDIGGSYTSGPMSLTVEVDDVSQANHPYTQWTVTGGYDLGGGLSLQAGANYTGDVMVGASMTF